MNASSLFKSALKKKEKGQKWVTCMRYSGVGPLQLFPETFESVQEEFTSAHTLCSQFTVDYTLQISPGHVKHIKRGVIMDHIPCNLTAAFHYLFRKLRDFFSKSWLFSSLPKNNLWRFVSSMQSCKNSLYFFPVKPWKPGLSVAVSYTQDICWEWISVFSLAVVVLSVGPSLFSFAFPLSADSVHYEAVDRYLSSLGKILPKSSFLLCTPLLLLFWLSTGCF